MKFFARNCVAANELERDGATGGRARGKETDISKVDTNEHCKLLVTNSKIGCVSF